MSNEELAKKIGEGGNDELLPLLWAQTRNFYYMLSDKYSRRYAERLTQRGLTADDLKQECYFSFLNTLKAYNKRPPEQSGYKFLSYARLSVRNHILRVLRFGVNDTDALDRCIVSLDEPLQTGEDEETPLLDNVTDKEAQVPLECIDNENFNKAFWSSVKAALSPVEYELIYRRFVLGQSWETIKFKMNLTEHYFFKTRNTARRKLKNNDAFLDTITDYFHGQGLTAWKRHRASSVERTAEIRELLR